MNAREIATCFREDCRVLRDSLQLEMVAAQYHLRMRSAQSHEGVPVGDALSAGVISALEFDDDELAHSVLKALAHVATGDTRERSRHAAARLEAAGVGLPPAFSDVCGARAVGAWRSTEGGFAGEYVLFADFEHPLGAAHALALFVEPRAGGRIKHIGLMSPVRDLPADAPFHPDAMDAIDFAAAGEMLADLLARSFGPELAETDDYRVLVGAARAASMRAAHLGKAASP